MKGIIEELESTNKWTFTFMGANINVMEVAHEGMSMSAGNTFSYVASNEGYRNMSEGINNSLKGYYDIRKKGETYTKDFFNLGTNSNGSDKKLDESTGNADSLKKEESTNGKKS